MANLTLKEQMEAINFDYTLPLYHGTNIDFDSDDLVVFNSKPGEPGKEMWDSFYLTQDKDRALEYAVRAYWGKNDGEHGKGKILVKKFKIKKEALAENLTLDIYLESNERTVEFIRQNIKKEKLSECIAKDADCQHCDLECPRNSEFVYGILVDGVIDDILDGIHSGLSDEELSNIIYQEIGLKRGYQLAVRKQALNCIKGTGTNTYSVEDLEVVELLERIKNEK